MNRNSCGSHLVEPGVKYFLKESLKQCHHAREQRYTVFYNLVAFVILIGLISTILWFMYKGKMTPVEKAMNERNKQEYILEKLRNIPAPQKEKGIITNLPKWQE